jgi:hypothetical protein
MNFKLKAMKRTALLFVFVILLYLISCKKNDSSGSNTNPTTDTTNVLNTNSHIIDTSMIQNVTDSSIELTKNSTSSALKAGDVIIANPTVSNPYGILREIKSVAENSNELTFSTGQSNLNDAFKQLYVSTTYLDTFYSSQTFRTGPKLSVKFSDDNTVAPGIKLNGELVFNIPAVQLEYKKKAGSIAPEKVLLQADFNTDGSTLEITNTDNSAIQIGEKILTSFNLPKIYLPVPVPTPVGVIIIRVPFSQNLNLRTLPLTISGKCKWTTLPKISATLGVKYENSTWTNLCTYNINASAMPLSRGDFTPNLGLTADVKFLTFEYDITPYNIDALKAFFSIPNTLDLTVQTASPNYLLKYRLDLTGGVKQEFYTGVKQEYSIKGNILTQTILQGDWQKTLASLTTKNVSSITQTSAVSGGTITDNGGDSITARGVCWSTSQNPTIANSKTSDGSGSGSFTSNLIGLTNNITYYLRAYATNSVGTAYGNQISFTSTQPTCYTQDTAQLLTGGATKLWRLIYLLHKKSDGTILQDCPVNPKGPYDTAYVFFREDNSSVGKYLSFGYSIPFPTPLDANCNIIGYVSQSAGGMTCVQNGIITSNSVKILEIGGTLKLFYKSGSDEYTLTYASWRVQ